MIAKYVSGKALFQFYLLVIYVVLQFCWWAYMINSLNKEVHDLKLKIEVYSNPNPQELETAHKELNDKLYKRWLMIAGEGTVFALILGMGIFRTRRALKAELNLGRQQKNFVLSVTHELKTPITAIRLQIETLLKHQLTVDKQEFVLQQALQETDRLNILVEKILLANRLENSAYLFQKNHFNLSELCQMTITSLKETLLRKHHVQTHITEGIWYKGDEQAFASVLINLIDNAARYSSENTGIYISLKQNQDAQITLEIKDEGRGISPTETALVFQKFYRADNEETRNSKGTGLGLYIVKNLVKLHHGQIFITPNSPKGTIFTIQLNNS